MRAHLSGVLIACVVGSAIPVAAQERIHAESTLGTQTPGPELQRALPTVLEARPLPHDGVSYLTPDTAPFATGQPYAGQGSSKAKYIVVIAVVVVALILLPIALHGTR
jgi:hypothetical protein